jgi:hypothetical protein
MICTRNNAGGYYKYMEGDLATIFAEALRTGGSGLSSSQFQVHEQTQTVQTVMTGKCAFRYGIEQHVNVEQEKLPDSSPTSIKPIDPPPPKYRPLFVSTNVH